jgi:uncharacterized protein
VGAAGGVGSDRGTEGIKQTRERGLDFADVGLVFAGATATIQDMRRDYGEDRYITIGRLRSRRVVLV